MPLPLIFRLCQQAYPLRLIAKVPSRYYWVPRYFFHGTYRVAQSVVPPNTTSIFLSVPQIQRQISPADPPCKSRLDPPRRSRSAPQIQITRLTYLLRIRPAFSPSYRSAPQIRPANSTNSQKADLLNCTSPIKSPIISSFSVVKAWAKQTE